MKNSPDIRGGLIVLTSYCLWGILPVYWKLLLHIPSDEIVTHRIIWSFFFMLILISLKSSHGNIVPVFRNIRLLALVAVCSFLVSLNWAVYIWAVNSGHMVDASMGYYINPVVSVLLASFFLKENIGWEGWTALLFAFSGIMVMIVKIGHVPWIALVLSLSFALYGLLKKILPVDAMTGLFVETAVSAPVALLYLVYINFHSGSGLTFHSDTFTWFLFIFAGAVTAVPLLLFGIGTRMVSLSIVGFLQYASPTLTLLLGVFVYREPMPAGKLLAFALIWAGLAIFTTARIIKGGFSDISPEIEEPV